MAYCERCDRFFGSESALDQHKADSTHHWVCNGCFNKDFTTWKGLKEHWVQSPRHQYCQYCEEHFDEFDDLKVHYKEGHWYCSRCNKVFVNEYGLHEHYRQSNVHHYCSPCKRDFMSASNLNSHNNSSIHRAKDVVCFRGCDMKFVSRSALLLHLEGGACESGVDRATINNYVRQYDTNNIITDPSRLLTSGTNDNIKYSASSRSWNGSGYECYLCHRDYPSLRSLNQHLESPAHQNRIYICPGSTCRTRFPTLSALCQHIESEKCGIHRFRVVQNTMDRLLGGMNRLTLS